MPIKYKDKPVVPYRGDYKPVNIYQGATKIAGWEPSPRSGEGPFEWDDTYNDKLTGTIGGKSVQAADYVYADGESGQEVTVQGKNLIPPFLASATSSNLGATMSVTKDGQSILINGVYTGETANGRLAFKNQSRSFLLRAGQTYTLSAFLQSGSYTGNANVIVSNMATNVLLSSLLVGSPGSFTPTEDVTCFVGIHCSVGSTYSNAVFVFQVEPGPTATAYAPFVPNSPSPDYPSPITPNVTAGIYKMTLPDGSIYEFTLPQDMHGLTGAQDRVVFDKKSKTGWADYKTALLTLNGSETYLLQSINSYGIANFYLVVNHIATASLSLCSRFKIQSTVIADTTSSGYYMGSLSVIYFRMSLTDLPTQTVAGFKSWLADNNVDILFVPTNSSGVATTARTPITFTKVASSAAPEFPTTALTVTEASPEYPLPIYVASGTITSHGSESFPAYEPTSFTFADLAAIPLPANATEWTYIDGNGVKWWADTEEWGKWDGVWRWKRTQRCGLWVFTGVSPYQIIKNDNTANSYLYYKTAIPNKKRGIGVCTHFSHVLSWPATAGKFSCSTPGHISTLFINFRGIVSADNATIPNSNEANAWLAAQYAVGTPVVVLYQLAEPTTECIHLGTLASFPRYTHAEQIQDGLKAHMQLNAKVIDR